MMRVCRTIRILVAAAALVATLGALAAGPVGAAPARQAGGTISGRVLSLDNVPLSGLTIAAYGQPAGGSRGAPVAQTTTAADGTYSLNVPAGTIWVSIVTGEQWGYDYTPIQVNAGDQIRDINFVPAVRVLPAGGPTPTVGAPAPTPAPLPTQAPAPTPVGMPRTGAPAAHDSAWLLLLAGLALGVLGLRYRTRRAG